MKTEVTLCGTVLIKITPEMIEAGAEALRNNPRWPRDLSSFDMAEIVLKAALGVEDD